MEELYKTRDLYKYSIIPPMAAGDVWCDYTSCDLVAYRTRDHNSEGKINSSLEDRSIFQTHCLSATVCSTLMEMYQVRARAFHVESTLKAALHRLNCVLLRRPHLMVWIIFKGRKTKARDDGRAQA